MSGHYGMNGHYGPVDRRSQVVIGNGGAPDARGADEHVPHPGRRPRARTLIMLGVVVLVLATAVTLSLIR